MTPGWALVLVVAGWPLSLLVGYVVGLAAGRAGR